MKKNNYKTMKALVALFFIGMSFILVSNTSFGADEPTKQVTSSSDYTVLAPLPCIEGNGVVCENGGNGALQPTVSFKTYIQYTINLLIGLSAVIAVVMIVWGGIEYMRSAAFTPKKEGLDKVKNAIYGLVLILVSYILLRTIDPRLVEIPNTLVPKIVVEEWLRQDAQDILMNKIIGDANRTVIENIEVSKRIDGIRAQKTATDGEIGAVNQEIAKLDKNNPANKSKLDELELRKKRLQAKSNDFEINKQFETATIYFNGIITKAITETVNSASNGTEMTYPERIGKVNEAKTLLGKNRDDFSSKLVKLGQLDLTTLNNRANYTEAMLDLYKVELSTVSAREVSEGATYQTKIVTQVVLVDGSIKTFAKPSDATNYINKEIAKVTAAKQQIKGDEKLQAELQNQIDIATKRLETNAVLNKIK